MSGNVPPPLGALFARPIDMFDHRIARRRRPPRAGHGRAGPPGKWHAHAARPRAGCGSRINRGYSYTYCLIYCPLATARIFSHDFRLR